MIEAIGAWIVCFRAPATKDELVRFTLCQQGKCLTIDFHARALQENIRTTLRTVHDVISHHSRSSYSAPEPLLVALAMPNSTTPALEIEEEEWEDLGRECGGWEYIDGGIPLSSAGNEGSKGGGKGKGKGRTNQYGEKVGIDRLVQALEANEWAGGGGGGVDEFDDDDGDGEGEEMKGVAGEDQGLEGELEFVGGDAQEEGTELREGLLDGKDGGGNEADAGGDEDVMALEGMMLKMQAVKEMGADMPEAERKRFAAKAVREVMKNM